MPPVMAPDVFRESVQLVTLYVWVGALDGVVQGGLAGGDGVVLLVPEGPGCARVPPEDGVEQVEIGRPGHVDAAGHGARCVPRERAVGDVVRLGRCPGWCCTRRSGRRGWRSTAGSRGSRLCPCSPRGRS